MPFPTTPQEFRDQGYKHLGNGSCKGCAGFIYWVQTPRGKKIPLNKDLTVHWENCPKAKEFRR
jgi:hypothetical protein